MSNLNKLDRVIVEIKRMISNNENFRKLLYYNTPDCLSLTAPTKAQIDSLIKVTPAIYMEEDPTAISLNSFGVIYVPNLNFSFQLNDITFIIDLFTKKEILELDNNQLRLHQMLAEVIDTIDNKRVSFAGRIEVKNATYVVVGSHYIGYQIELSVIDEAPENDF